MSESFKKFSLVEPLLNSLSAMGFENPTPIQEKAMPLILEGGDLIACAQTGSGKTAAFALPMFQKLYANPQATALILAPTRELAEQIHRVCLELGQFMPQFRTSLLIGGTSHFPQKRTLAKNPRVIVATPGRLLDHLQQKSARLDQLAYLVLDEADRMLDMGFQPQLRAITRFLPKERQSVLFSATIPENILALSRDYLKNPRRIEIEKTEALAPKIKEVTMSVEGTAKKQALIDAVAARPGSMLVFTRTQQRTERVAHFLEVYGVKVTQLHGGRSHGQRQSAIRGFREGSFRVLVATDIAARGLDIDHVEHVINYDLPRCPEDYVHRIGRTGRAGREGEALSLIEGSERGLWNAIQRLKNPKPERPRGFFNKGRDSQRPSQDSSADALNEGSPSEEGAFSPKKSFNKGRRFKKPFGRRSPEGSHAPGGGRFSGPRENQGQSRFSGPRENQGQGRFSGPRRNESHGPGHGQSNGQSRRSENSFGPGRSQRHGGHQKSARPFSQKAGS